MGERPRILSEAEVSEVLRAAAELQEASGKEYSAGVTLDELKRIAAEAGIAPEFLEQAIRSPKPKTVATSPLRLSEETEVVVDGEVAPENLDLLLTKMREKGKVDKFQQVGRSLTAEVTKSPMWARVELFSRGGRTRVKVKSSPFFPYFLGLHAPLIGACIAGPLVGSHVNPITGILVAAATVATGLGLFQFFNRTSIRRSRELAGWLGEQVNEIAAEPTTEQQTESLEERLEQQT
ncbi:MAG: hypothetical protein IT207_11985 [Fimbriimonadaceae bacterium]|nr:hypothetical protein [Fimbriimonadaceae bacterium]